MLNEVIRVEQTATYCTVDYILLYITMSLIESVPYTIF